MIITILSILAHTHQDRDLARVLYWIIWIPNEYGYRLFHWNSIF